MVTGRIGVQTKDRSGDLRKTLQQLGKKDVLVGIPEENSSRKTGDAINNAELLYAHSHGIRKKEMRDEMKQEMDGGKTYSAAHSLYVQSHGSPLWQAPPRPVLEPAIEDKKEIIGNKISEAVKAALSGDPNRAELELTQAGMLAAAAAQNWFEDPKNGWAPNSEKTIAKKGSDLPLIDTDEMRKAITYVVRDKA